MDTSLSKSHCQQRVHCRESRATTTMKRPGPAQDSQFRTHQATVSKAVNAPQNSPGSCFDQLYQCIQIKSSPTPRLPSLHPILPLRCSSPSHKHKPAHKQGIKAFNLALSPSSAAGIGRGGEVMRGGNPGHLACLVSSLRLSHSPPNSMSPTPPTWRSQRSSESLSPLLGCICLMLLFQQDRRHAL